MSLSADETDVVTRSYRASYASTVLAVIVCLSVCHKSELYKDN